MMENWDGENSMRVLTQLLERRKRRQKSAVRCTHLRFGLPMMKSGNRVVVKGAVDWFKRATTSNAKDA